MNQQHKDIISTIERYGPITTAGIADILSKPLYGYGGTMSEEELKDQVSKINGYLKKKGLLTSEERPQAKGKPLMFWSLAESQPEEMASDVAEVEAVTEEFSATDKESLTVADANLIETRDSLDTVREVEERKAMINANWEAFKKEFEDDNLGESKAAVKLTNMSIHEAMTEFYSCGYENSDLPAFLAGIEFAEKHHGISP